MGHVRDLWRARYSSTKKVVSSKRRMSALTSTSYFDLNSAVSLGIGTTPCSDQFTDCRAMHQCARIMRISTHGGCTTGYMCAPGPKALLLPPASGAMHAVLPCQPCSSCLPCITRGEEKEVSLSSACRTAGIGPSAVRLMRTFRSWSARQSVGKSRTLSHLLSIPEQAEGGKLRVLSACMLPSRNMLAAQQCRQGSMR